MVVRLWWIISNQDCMGGRVLTSMYRGEIGLILL